MQGTKLGSIEGLFQINIAAEERIVFFVDEADVSLSSLVVMPVIVGLSIILSGLVLVVLDDVTVLIDQANQNFSIKG
jgi:hypothetical protein